MTDCNRNWKLSRVRDVRLSQADREEIWQAVAAELAVQKEKQPVARTPLWRYSLAGIAAFVVVSAGIFTYLLEGQHQVVSPNIGPVTESKSTIQPEMFLFPEWRVVVIPSMRKQGPYYDIDYYYIGATPAHMHSVISAGLTNEFSGDAGAMAITTGLVFGQGDLYFPKGLKSYSATLYWDEKSTTKSETISLAGTPVPLRILKSARYVGESAHWQGVMNERVIGNETFESNPEMVIHLSWRGGIQPSGQAKIQILEDTGNVKTEETIGNGGIVISTGIGTDNYKKQLIRGVEITWQGSTETVLFSRQHD